MRTMVSSISLCQDHTVTTSVCVSNGFLHSQEVPFVASDGHGGGQHPQSCKCNRRLDDLSLGHPVRMLTCMDARFQISVPDNSSKPAR
jgi:hypothetical protein